MKRINTILLLLVVPFYSVAMEKNLIVFQSAQAEQGLSDEYMKALKDKYFRFGQGDCAQELPVTLSHNTQVKNVASKKDTHSTVTHTCLLCKESQKNFDTLDTLRSHLKNHNNFYCYPCSHAGCSKRFIVEADMIQHRGSHKEWICACPWEYPSFDEYSGHCRHFRHLFYVCYFCKLRFKHIKGLREHEVEKHQREIIEYKDMN